MHVETDKVIYRPGETVGLTATAFDESFEQTTKYELKAGWAAPSARPLALPSSNLTADDALQVYRGELVTRAGEDLTLQPAATQAVMREAKLQVVATGENGEEVARMTLDIQLLDDSIELLNPRPAPENLKMLADSSGGRVLSRPAELTMLLRELETSEGEVLVHQTPLWDHPLLWLLLLGLLVSEWSLRRRAGFG